MGMRIFAVVLVAPWVLQQQAMGAKAKHAEMDEDCLPELDDVLEEVGLAEFAGKIGVDRTLALVRWDRTDIHINGYELGWTKEQSATLLKKLQSLRETCAKKVEAEGVDDKLLKLREQRATLSYGRLYLDRSTASFEFKKAWFGTQALPEDKMRLVRAVPVDGCGTLVANSYAGAAVLADRGGCTFLEKAWAAHYAGASALLVVNTAEAAFERPASGHVTEEVERPTPASLAVALLPVEAGPALRAVAAAALDDDSVAAAQGLRRRDVRKPPFDVADASEVRFVPVKCAAGQPDCRPLLPAEKALTADVSSGHIHLSTDDDKIEFVTSVWGGVFPGRPMQVVLAEPHDLCAPPPNRLCRSFPSLCFLTGSSALAAATAVLTPSSLIVADRGNCSFGVKARHAVLLGASALAIVERGSAPLLRLGVRLNSTDKLPPSIPALVIDAFDGDRLVKVANTNVTLTFAEPPFAQKWLELAEAELDWPQNALTAKLLTRRLNEANSDSPARLRWLRSSIAQQDQACTPEDGTCKGS